MEISATAVAFVLCGVCGALLALMELVRTFGKWIGRRGLNRYAAALILLNVAAACLVYAFLRYVLGVESNVWLVIVTGLTFPTILRSKLTFVQLPGDDGSTQDRKAVSLPVHEWYRMLQTLCLQEIHRGIASQNSKHIRLLRDRLSEGQMVEALKDHIVGETLEESRSRHESQVEQFESLGDPGERVRQLARLMLDIMPQSDVRELMEREH